ncbi:hypothetical protein NBRC10512_002946 [Rhodotorula toruloides]|uniref:mRNA-capping enzyme subunit beta n=2 Tax=Rhodotorula toruloides TaxID=5286 RepID=A0A061BFH8_RHOTO|nr:mRNA capping enzyme [Rhodotorula toruloides NP11]EMS19496.1 mRNA capping enzyme [Rhodotorula toruloides NP11]KAJ8291594.1 mRNA-capping enzyme subunit beta [Rhodotorula toruloides]CDR48750.1 RHTO0S20e00584g1_1 [Rhodotorula toruloides]
MPSPFSRAGQLPPKQSPKASPSLSPSIHSLLNNPSEVDTPFDSDYFGAPGGQDASSLFAAEGSNGSRKASSPSPTAMPPSAAATASPGPVGFRNLLTPDPAHTYGGEAAQRPHKRARPTSSSSSIGSFSTGAGAFDGPNGSRAAEDEEEGAMQPPATRVRRSSSTSSTPAPAPSTPTIPRRSASPTRQNPPAPAPVASTSTARSAPPPPPPAPARRGSLALEPSIFNVEPIDEFTREVADWLWGFCAQLDWDTVEIEAKIGLLVDRNGGMRVNLPVPIETILTDDSGLRFESNMTVNQHKAFNQLLNSRVEESAHPSYAFAPVRYSHTRELDTFHEIPAMQGQPKRKVRVTRDQKDKSKPPIAVEKVRVADMNIFSPKRLFDWRVSVSLEMPAPIPDTPPTHSRYKDRISYSHQLFQVDLTQVTVPSSPKPTHELEIEFKRARGLLEEAAKEQRGEENKYLEMVQVLLNNIRMLIRNASNP